MTKAEVICIASARPNFMKIKPVMDALEQSGASTILVHTGQHYDPAMSDIFFDDIGLRQPDHHLGIGSGSFAEQTARVTSAFGSLLEVQDASALVVVGDVTPTPACAVVGAHAGMLVCHVEAGLRSRDWSMPEEINRVVTDAVSDLLFAPSADAVENLKGEGVAEERIVLAGNVMVDTLLTNLDRAMSQPILSQLGLEKGTYALATLHRPSNVDDPSSLEVLLGILEEVARSTPVVFPVHPRTARLLAGRKLRGVTTIDPLGYLDFVALEASAAIVLTDSGGVQEETTALGVPCLTLRENTERPVTISEGTNQLVGSNPEIVLAAFASTLRAVPSSRKGPMLWDGQAGERIARAILASLDAGEWVRPSQAQAPEGGVRTVPSA